MADKEINDLKEENVYLAHVDYETQRIQDAKTHLQHVADFAYQNCPIQELKVLAYLAGIMHDAGKLGEENQKDFEKILESGDQVHKNGLDHSTAGGRLIQELVNVPIVTEMISTAIYFHHGVSDCIDLETGVSVQKQRREKEIPYSLIEKRFKQTMDWESLEEQCPEILKSLKSIYDRIDNFSKNCKWKQMHCGDSHFFLGMYLRVLLSLLIDGDWTDTSSFFEDVPLKKRISVEEVQDVWETCIENFESYMSETVRLNPENGSLLNDCRQEISDLCRQAADTEKSLYRLTVPTGAGKTLSSLRFALYHAKREQKQHIIYVAPFNSILEQNAEEIRKAVKNAGIVLEHHCNVVCEKENEERYKSLTETWDSPIIVTTAVQLLNTLFSSGRGYIRRMHALCNSVIIFDEVQSIPVRCTELFHEAVNFLSQFGKTTVVLCSATQPTLAKLKENNVYPCAEMAGNLQKYARAFQRTEIIDDTGWCRAGMEIEDLKKYTLKKTESYGNTLVIVNTTSCAYKLFRALKEELPGEYKIFHLSSNMCPQHRMDTLAKIKTALKDKAAHVICVSTQVVEAGVNFSFHCVIRSKAGLDNVVQAAGRCNRHKEFLMGLVFIVQMSKTAENLDRLPEIRLAQQALDEVLYYFRIHPEMFEGALDSEKSIQAYYTSYYRILKNSNENETKFPEKRYQMTLVELLGFNGPARKQYESHYQQEYSAKSSKVPKVCFAQAFLTAGEEFQVIADDGKTSLIVPYDEKARKLIADLLSEHLDFEEQKRILREMQRYTVRISKQRKEKLGDAIYEIGDGTIQVLSEGYYDYETGVSEEMVVGSGMSDRSDMGFYID